MQFDRSDWHLVLHNVKTKAKYDIWFRYYIAHFACNRCAIYLGLIMKECPSIMHIPPAVCIARSNL